MKPAVTALALCCCLACKFGFWWSLDAMWTFEDLQLDKKWLETQLELSWTGRKVKDSWLDFWWLHFMLSVQILNRKSLKCSMLRVIPGTLPRMRTYIGNPSKCTVYPSKGHTQGLPGIFFYCVRGPLLKFLFFFVLYIHFPVLPILQTLQVR